MNPVTVKNMRFQEREEFHDFCDEVTYVHRALEGIRSLMMDAKVNPSGIPASLEMVAKDDFAALLGIVNDRLGEALKGTSD